MSVGPEENYGFLHCFAVLLPEDSGGPKGDISERLKPNYLSWNFPNSSAWFKPMRSNIFPINYVLMPPLPTCCPLSVSDGCNPNA